MTAPSAMTAAEAAEVRTRVWTPYMQQLGLLDFHREGRCPCQGGNSGFCDRGVHDRCTSATPRQVCPETEIRGGDEHTTRRFTEPYEHPAPTLAGVRPTRVALVWLADRRCRWVCRCSCHTTGDRVEDAAGGLFPAEPAAAKPRRATGRGAPALAPGWELVPLFEVPGEAP